MTYYPLCTDHPLTKAYEMIHETYKVMLRDYAPEHISVLGTSSGGNLALGKRRESIMKLSLKEYGAMQSGWRKWINEHMEISGFKAWGMDFTGKDILEVGCGSGYSASLIVKDHPKSYTGMDIMPEQLEKAEALQLPDARFVQGDAADLSRFADGSFDMIVDFMILHHVEGWRRFLDEAFRVLRPGGEMYINDLTRKGVHLTDFLFRWDHAEEPLFTMQEFGEQALRSGFAAIKRCNYAGLDFCFKFQKAIE